MSFRQAKSALQNKIFAVFGKFSKSATHKQFLLLLLLFALKQLFCFYCITREYCLVVQVFLVVVTVVVVEWVQLHKELYTTNKDGWTTREEDKARYIWRNCFKWNMGNSIFISWFCISCSCFTSVLYLGKSRRYEYIFFVYFHTLSLIFI